MSSFAHTQSPDFAFPATVSKNAQAKLNDFDFTKQHSVEEQDTAMSLQIQDFLARTKISPDDAPGCIKDLENRLNQIADPDLYALSACFLAKCYYAYYDRDEWKYNQRRLPLSPRPEDISAWSGEMFKMHITELIEQAVDKSQSLSTPVTRFKNSICSDEKLSVMCHPTIADFIAAEAIEICESIDNDTLKKEILDKAVAHAGTPASKIAWEIRRAESGVYYKKRYVALENLYRDYSSNPFASLILLSMYDYLEYSESDNNPDEYAPAMLASEMEKSLKKGKDLPKTLKSALEGCLEDLKTPKIKISFPSLIADSKIEVKVKSESAEKILIRMYAIPEDVAINSRKFNDFSLNDPIAEKTVTFSKKAPFKAENSIEMRVPEEGYYVIIPEICDYAGDVYTHRLTVNDVVRRVSVMPVYLTSVSTPSALLLNSATGVPIADAKITTLYDGKTVSTGRTDSTGYVCIGDGNFRASTLVAEIGDKKYSFRDLYLNRYSSGADSHDNYKATVLTDRAIYHPGEEVNFLAVCSVLKKGMKEGNSALCSGKEIKIKLFDVNYQCVDTLALTTDAMGRASGKFVLPGDGLTGKFSLRVLDVPSGDNIGSSRIMVSDYKMPQFEFSELKVSRDCPEKGSVTIDGCLRTYSGMPVANANITANLSTLSFWRWAEDDEELQSLDIESDSEGRFSVVFTAEMLQTADNPNRFFRAQFTATSQAGETVDGGTTFAVGKPYMINVSVDDNNVNGEKPMAAHVEIVDPSGEKHDAPLTWSLTCDNSKKEVASGSFSGTIDVSKVRPGRYTLTFAPVDSTLADPDSTEIVIYNEKSGIVPTDSRIWCPISSISDGDAHHDVLVATTGKETCLYVAVNIADTLQKVSLYRFAEGYHHIDLHLPEGCRSANVQIFAVNDCEIYRHDLQVDIPEAKGLKITAESMRDRLTPATSETWKFRITDHNGNPANAALVLDLYNKALEALQSHSLDLYFPTRRLRNTMSLYCNSAGALSYNITGKNYFFSPHFDVAPQFNFYNQKLYHSVIEYCLAGSSASIPDSSNAKMRSIRAESAADFAVAESESEDAILEDENAEHAEQESFSFREADVPLAAWAPMLTTDADGFVTFTFTVPDAITTWRLQTVAWDGSTAVGSMMRDFIANKPLMVQPLLPRFLRRGDTAEIRATVYNNADSATTATVTYELYNPLTSQAIATEQKTIEIAANGQNTVSFSLSTLTDGMETIPAAGVRIKAASQTFADGEQTVLPLLSSMAELVETKPFYLNPGDSIFTTALPSDSDAHITLTYCDNPVWSIVSALPGLRDEVGEYANSAAAAIFSACVSRGILADNPHIAQVLKQWTDNPNDSNLISRLEQNEDLKIALLSATPWVQNAMSQTARMQRLNLIFDEPTLDSAVADGLAVLKKLQRPDGGYPWGSWCDKSSPWVTMNVLEMMADLNRFGWLPADADLRESICSAIKFADATVEDTDIAYSAIRPFLNELVPVSENGQKVIKTTVDEILKNWKEYDADYKALAARVLWLNDYSKKAKELLSSIVEFGVSSDSQGIKIPSINSICEYATVLDAFGLIEPESPMVDGLRQYLIVRKQANDWGSFVITMQTVTAILSSGTKWTDNQPDPEIMIDNTEIRPTSPVDAVTGSLRVDLSPYAGATLAIKRGDAPDLGPAYGAVYARFKQKMTDVEAESCSDLSIEKHLYLRRGTEWVNTDSLRVGDRVKVSLTIRTKRNLSFVSVTDERPAAFAPVEQLPGWIWSDGAGFYRENRDAVTNLSIDYLRPGTYILEYEMNVQHAGEFSSGVASIQSQYAPELAAHSAGCAIRIEE